MRNAAALAAVAALACSACAQGHRARFATQAVSRGTRAAFVPGDFEKVFATAADLVRRRGHAIVTCEPELGALTTAPIELDARCGNTTCLARETTAVKLGYRRARVTLTREVWDPALRGWREQDDRDTGEELSREERALVSRMVGVGGAAQPPPRHDPCDPSRCRDGSCVATTADPSR